MQQDLLAQSAISVWDGFSMYQTLSSVPNNGGRDRLHTDVGSRRPYYTETYHAWDISFIIYMDFGHYSHKLFFTKHSHNVRH